MAEGLNIRRSRSIVGKGDNVGFFSDLKEDIAKAVAEDISGDKALEEKEKTVSYYCENSQVHELR